MALVFLQRVEQGLEVVSKIRITPEGKAQGVEKT
jgi:hypothetical protein